MAYNKCMHASHLRRRERENLVAWMAGQPFTHALTLNTDRELSGPNIGSMFGIFCHEFDKSLHGRKLKRVPQSARLHAIAFAENLSSNAHLHACADLRLASEFTGGEAIAVELARVCWMRATNGAGSFCHKPRPDAGWGNYCTKRFDGTYYLSADFWPL